MGCCARVPSVLRPEEIIRPLLPLAAERLRRIEFPPYTYDTESEKLVSIGIDRSPNRVSCQPFSYVVAGVLHGLTTLLSESPEGPFIGGFNEQESTIGLSTIQQQLP